MNDTPIIVAENLTCRFGTTVAVDHVSFAVQPGGITGLLGPNGAGKTTTLRMLLGLVPPESGRATVLGCPSARLSPQTKARIGYVPEEDALYGWKSVQGMLRFHGGFYPGYTDAHGLALLKRFDLPPRKLVARLSKGTRRRLSVVLALSVQPDVLVLDEPAAGFDPAVRRVLLECLTEFVRDGQRAVLLSTHIMSDIERIADKIALMRGAHLLLHTDLDDLRDGCRILLLDPTHTRGEVARAFTILKWTPQTDGTEAIVANYREPHSLRVREAYPMNLDDIFIHLVQNGGDHEQVHS